MTIDSHQHFWQYDRQKHSWMSDQMGAIKRDFLPDDLEEVLKANGLDGCVAVQADQSEEETHFLNNLADAYDFIKGTVGWVDLRASNVSERLDQLSHLKSVKGFRHVVQDEPDPEFMLQKSFLNGISKLETHGFTYDILIFPNQLPAAIELTRRFPNQKFVLDHIAKPLIEKGELGDWLDGIHELAKSENTTCKVSGMVTEANWKNWRYEDFLPYLETVFEAFGVERIMYGSDWPVCLVSCDYGKMKSILDRYIEDFSENERSAIMGGVAAKFYDLA
ncbi:MAG: amidohydrolase family protein [Cyclobacteriaceae bacterium]